MDRARRYAVFAVRALRLVDDRQKVVQNQCIDRAQSDACSTTEAPVIVYDEELR